MSYLLYQRRAKLLLAALLCPTLAWHGLLSQAKTAPEAVASPNLASAARQIAEEAAKCVQKHAGKSLVVGPFLGPPGGSGGTVLADSILSQLPRNLPTVPGAGGCGLIGTYRFTKDKQEGLMSVIIETRVTNSLGEPLQLLTTWTLTDNASLEALSR